MVTKYTLIEKILMSVSFLLIIGSHLYFMLGGTWSESYEFGHNIGNVVAGAYLFYMIYFRGKK